MFLMTAISASFLYLIINDVDDAVATDVNEDKGRTQNTHHSDVVQKGFELRINGSRVVKHATAGPMLTLLCWFMHSCRCLSQYPATAVDDTSQVSLSGK